MSRTDILHALQVPFAIAFDVPHRFSAPPSAVVELCNVVSACDTQPALYATVKRLQICDCSLQKYSQHLYHTRLLHWCLTSWSAGAVRFTTEMVWWSIAWVKSDSITWLARLFLTCSAVCHFERYSLRMVATISIQHGCSFHGCLLVGGFWPGSKRFRCDSCISFVTMCCCNGAHVYLFCQGQISRYAEVVIALYVCMIVCFSCRYTALHALPATLQYANPKPHVHRQVIHAVHEFSHSAETNK